MFDFRNENVYSSQSLNITSYFFRTDIVFYNAIEMRNIKIHEYIHLHCGILHILAKRENPFDIDPKQKSAKLKLMFVVFYNQSLYT